MAFDGSSEVVRPVDRARLTDLTSAVRSSRPGSLLVDIGCWTSWAGPDLRAVASSYVGVDVPQALKALRVARARVPDGAFVAVEHVSALPFPDATVDAIVFTEVIEHVPRGAERRVLHELARVLRPGGVVALSTPVAGPLAALDPAWYFGHRHYRPATLRKWVHEAGFEVRVLDYFGGPASAVDALAMYGCKHLLRRPYRGWAPLDRMASRHARLGRGRWTATGVWLELRRPGVDAET